MRCECVASAVDDPVRVGRQVNIAAVQDARLQQEFVADVEPRETICVAAGEVGQHPRVTWVGLGRPSVEIGCSAHLQTGHVGNRNLPVGGDRQQELRVRCGYVDHDRDCAVAGGVVDEFLDRGLVVEDRTGEEFDAVGRGCLREVIRLGHVDADEHSDLG